MEPNTRLDHDAALAAELELVLAHEREAVATELQDTLGRILAAINLRAGLLRLVIDDDLSTEARDLEALARRGLTALRRATTTISSLSTEEPDLVATLKELSSAYESTHTTEVVLDVRGGDDLPVYVREALIRVVQEGLANVERHAEARRVAITLEADDRLAVLRVRDDGRGTSRAPADGGIGLGLELARRAVEPMGGTIELADAEPGAELTARVPLGADIDLR